MDTALLWFDMVGSTRLANSLLKSGQAGIEQLSALFDRHFDALLNCVVAHGGQPLMFAGDGLLSGWPCVDHEPSQAALRAAQCAEDILSIESPTGLIDPPLRLHAILAFGQCRTMEIAANGYQTYVTTGEALRDLQTTTHIRAAGQLIVTARTLEVLGQLAEVSVRDRGCGILQKIPLHVSPTPLQVPPPTGLKRNRLAAHIPPQLAAAHLDPNQVEWATELRHVTVVFSSLPDLDCGSTDIAGGLEEVMKAALPLVHHYDGLVHQLRVDDGGANLLILFGTRPVAHFDDPVRGVRLATELRDTLRRVGYRSTIGVATSHALCGVIGNDIFRTYMVHGASINLASRLKVVKLGAVHCDDATMRRAQGVMNFDPLGDAQVKGVSSPIPIWTPRRQTKPEVSTPMLGRDAELEILMRAQRAAELNKPARVVLMKAEAGMGKSRLLAEFRKRAAATNTRVLSASADRIERHVPYHGWKSIYTKLLGIDQLNDAKTCKESVLKLLGAERTDQSPLLNAVLPFEFSETDHTLDLSAGQRADERRKLMVSLLREAALSGTRAVIIDDAHWLDDASWEIAYHVAAEVDGICLILSMQPLEDDSPLKRLIQDGAQQLDLRELSDFEQGHLICARLDVQNITQDAAQLVGKRARGHPFFCIELAQSLLEEGVLEVVDGVCRIAKHVRETSLPLPDTIHGTIVRRIDRLDSGPKLTLKTASAAGIRFPSALVREVYPLDNERNHVDDFLLSNERFGLLIPERVDDMEGYAFQHGIIRDVAYDLIIFSRRKQLHLQIAEWYERSFANSLSRYYPSLAHHFEAAEEPERAACYLALEAQRTFSLGLGRQSVTTGLRAAALLGAALSSDPKGTRRELARELDRISVLLAERSPAELVALPPIDEPKVDDLLRLLVTIAPFAFQSQQIELFGLIIATALRLTLEHGNGPTAAEVYSMFSVVSGGLSGDRIAAAAWSRLALNMLGDARDNRFGRVAFIHGWFHNHWIGSIKDSISLSRAGAEAALADKEVIFGCFNLAACVIYLAAAGHPLAEVMATARSHLERIKGRVMNAAFHVKLELQVAKAIAGLTRGPLDLGDPEFDEAQDIASICRTELSNQTGYYFVSKAKLHTHFGDWSGALTWTEQASQILPFFSGQIAECELVQFQGVAALAEAAFGAPSDAKTLEEEGQDCIEKMRQWNELNTSKSSLFGHKADLLAGIMGCINEPTERAATLLEKSAQKAMEADHLSDAVLAYEFLARCYRKSHRDEEAAMALSQALDMCNLWGAKAKVTFLREDFAAATA